MATPDPHVASHLALLARLELLHRSPSPSSDVWVEVAELARTLADGLRDASLRLPLARSSLPSTLADLLRLALALPSPLLSPASLAAVAALPARRPDGVRADAAVEVLRAAGNCAFDCDTARTRLLEASFPQLVLALLAALADTAPEGDVREANGAFRLAKTALGALMNVGMEHEGTQKALLGMDGALETLLRITNAVYLPTPFGAPASPGEGAAEDRWATREERATVAGWGWRVFGDLCAVDGASATLDPLASSLLPHLLPPLLSYVPAPHAPAPPLYPASQLAADLALLTGAAQALESRALDAEPWQAALFARPEFGQLLDFVERAGPPAVVQDAESDDDDDDDDEGSTPEAVEKRFGSLKGGVVKCIVAVFGHDAVGEQVFAAATAEGAGGGQGGGGELGRLRTWLQREAGGEREDMVICAVLSLGNLARSEAHCLALLRPPFALLPSLTPLLAPTTDIKVQHALLGLLKNLSVPAGNKALLAEAGVMEGVVLGLGAWKEERDAVGSVQGGAVGVVKNLCKGTPQDAARLVLPSRAHADARILPLLLALHRRSDDFALRSEASRVLVHAVRALYSLAPGEAAGGERADAGVKEARAALASVDVVDVLVGLLDGGARQGYSVLVVEAVLALALLASSAVQTAGIVSTALLTPSAARSPAPEPTSPSTPTAAAPSPPLALLASLLTPPPDSAAKLQRTPELKGNVCTLLTAAGRAAGEEKSRYRAVLEGWDVEEGEQGADGLQRARELGLRVLE